MRTIADGDLFPLQEEVSLFNNKMLDQCKSAIKTRVQCQGRKKGTVWMQRELEEDWNQLFGKNVIYRRSVRCRKYSRFCTVVEISAERSEQLLTKYGQSILTNCSKNLQKLLSVLINSTKRAEFSTVTEATVHVYCSPSGVHLHFMTGRDIAAHSWDLLRSADMCPLWKGAR